MRGAAIAAAVAWLALGSALHAELRFESERIVLNPNAGTADVSADFTFENTGAAPVRITGVRSDCGCTATVLERDLILPGRTGRIRADFHVGSRQGRNNVAIHVTTDEGRSSPYLLTLEVNIKVAVNVLPRFVHWRIGGQPEEKPIRVTFEEGYRFVGAESSTADFNVGVADSNGHSVQLTVTPRDLWAKRSGTIQLKFTTREGAPLEIPVHLRIL